MEKCNIDHTLNDVKQKYEDQKMHLPAELADSWKLFLSRSASPSQDDLNEAFHLLKKYDLSSEQDREERNKKMFVFFKQQNE